MQRRILIFVEDPGAALFLRDLPAALQEHDVHPLVMAGPHAASHFDPALLIAPPKDCGAAAATAMLHEMSPDALVAGTSENLDSFAFALLAAARESGVPSFGAIDCAANAEFRFKGRTDDPLAFAPDHLLVSDSASANAFLEIGVAEMQITVCGHPQLYAMARLRDTWGPNERREHRARWFPAVEPERPIFVFVSELSDGLGENRYRRAADYQLHGTSGSNARTEIVAEEFQMAARALPSRPHLVLRLHPKQVVSDEAALASLFDQVSQKEPALEIAHAADRVIGMTSILLVEAAMLGRPVLSVVPRPSERFWLGDMAEAIPCVWTRDDLAKHLAGGARSVAAGTGSHAAPAQVMCDRILSLKRT